MSHTCCVMLGLWTLMMMNDVDDDDDDDDEGPENRRYNY